MSFILDALKKSESERQRQAGPALLEMRIVRPPRRLPIWALVVGVLLIISVGVLAWLALRPAPAPAIAAAPALAPATVPATAPAAGATSAASGPALAPTTLATAPAAPSTMVQSPAQSATAATDNNPADTEPAVTPASNVQEANNASNLHTYAELGGALPELRLDLHVYAANPAERYAFINMHKVREGDTTAEGVQVKEITREGVVLDYRGTEFLLGRQ
jgi:general secretion pathway protein B